MRLSADKRALREMMAEWWEERTGKCLNGFKVMMLVLGIWINGSFSVMD